MTPLTRRILPTPRQTPLLKDGDVWIKLESAQLTGSVKYRLVYDKVSTALTAGHIDAQTTLTEVTSGSSGVALAYVAAFLGINAVIHVYDTACPRKCARIRNYGAQLVTHPRETTVPHILKLIEAQVKDGGYWHLNQYHRQSNLMAYRALAQEIVQQIAACAAPPPRTFACPVGTGGLVQGVGSYLRTVWPIKIVAIEPERHVAISGMRNTLAVHMGADDPYDAGFPDIRLTVQAPKAHTQVDGFVLGNTATVVYEAVREKGWQDVLIIAAD